MERGLGGNHGFNSVWKDSKILDWTKIRWLQYLTYDDKIAIGWSKVRGLGDI